MLRLIEMTDLFKKYTRCRQSNCRSVCSELARADIGNFLTEHIFAVRRGTFRRYLYLKAVAVRGQRPMETSSPGRSILVAKLRSECYVIIY